jgi:hypothetical protein
MKTVFEKNFIALEAKKACETLAKGGATLPESVDALVEGCKHVKNLSLAENASVYLAELVKHMPEEYFSA